MNTLQHTKPSQLKKNFRGINKLGHYLQSDSDINDFFIFRKFYALTKVFHLSIITHLLKGFIHALLHTYWCALHIY